MDPSAERMRPCSTCHAVFMRRGHMHRLPQLLTYEVVRWAWFQSGRLMGHHPPAASGGYA